MNTNKSVRYTRVAAHLSGVCAIAGNVLFIRGSTTFFDHSILASWIFMVIAEPAMMDSSASNEPSESVDMPVMP